MDMPKAQPEPRSSDGPDGNARASLDMVSSCSNTRNGKEDPRKPAACVLSRVVTGLATVRGLAEGHMPVTAISYARREPLHYSRLCKIFRVPSYIETEEQYIGWLANHCAEQGGRPVLLPTSDVDALLLAKYSERIQPVARTWSTCYSNLAAIVDKSTLYLHAEHAGVPTVPTLKEPVPEQLEDWCSQYEPPYLLKPFYNGIPDCALNDKNKCFDAASALISYAKRYGMRACLVQRLMAGGDGYIFDTYGLSDSNHSIVSYATHRRWRQFPPDIGITSFGEIPVNFSGDVEILFEYTQRLIAQTQYHGIFGIEWLLDRRTGHWYLLDFNARPFSSIGHLTDCGLNLPLLAYYELTESLPDGVQQRPSLRHCYWINFIEDLKTLVTPPHLPLLQWVRSVLRCRSFAYWSLRDPGPAIYRLWELVPLSLRVLRRATSRRLGRVSGTPQLQPKRSAWTE
jgi:predicted ATP-grasp superfamily ATP-dependent carboligase